MITQTGSPSAFAGLRFILRPEYSRYLLLFAGLFILLVVVAVITAMVRRSRRTSQGPLGQLPFQNLDQMKKQGMLTPEEVKHIRMAMARRIMDADNQPTATLDTLQAEALRAVTTNRARKPADSATPHSDAPPAAPGNAMPEKSDDLPSEVEELR